MQTQDNVLRAEQSELDVFKESSISLFSGGFSVDDKELTYNIKPQQESTPSQSDSQSEQVAPTITDEDLDELVKNAIPQSDNHLASPDLDEPSLDEQYKINRAINEHQVRYIKNKVYADTGMSIDNDDPLMQWFITNLSVLMSVSRDVSQSTRKHLDSYKNELFTHINKEMQKGAVFIARERAESNKAFEKNLNELRELTKSTEDKKAQFIAEITYRLEHDIDEKINVAFHERLKNFTEIMDKNFNTLAQKAHTQVNNDRVISQGRLQGAGVGLLIGVIVAVIMATILK